MNRYRYLLFHVGLPAGGFALLAWLSQWSGFDFQVAAAMFDPVARHFPWGQHHLLEVLGHRAVLALPIGVAVAALGGLAASFRVERLRPWRGVLIALLLTCLIGQVTISNLKEMTALPRPYALLRFGGDTVLPSGFWALAGSQPGGAMPSGHAGAGYSLLVLYFAGWARRIDWLRWTGLALGLGCGLLFSAVRIMQGAHFLSQTLASGAVMWAIAGLAFMPLLCGRTGDGIGPGRPVFA